MKGLLIKEMSDGDYNTLGRMLVEQHKFRKRPIISQDEITNLRIDLNTTRTVNEFLGTESIAGYKSLTICETTYNPGNLVASYMKVIKRGK